MTKPDKTSLSIYFRSEANVVRKWPKITPPITIGTYIHTDVLNSHIGYDVTDYFRLAVMEVQITVGNAASDNFGLNFSRKI